MASFAPAQAPAYRTSQPQEAPRRATRPRRSAQTTATPRVAGGVLWIVVVAALLAGIVAFIRPMVGEWIYGVSGLLAAAGLALAAVLDLMDKDHMVQSPFLTFLFAGILAIASSASIRDAYASVGVDTGPSV